MDLSFLDIYRSFLLKNIKDAKIASGGSHICGRCQNTSCEDHYDHGNGHFYISLPTETQRSQFYCHKCHYHGTVNGYTLQSWGISDPDIVNGLNRWYDELPTGVQYKHKRVVFKAANPFPSVCKLSDVKLQYINQRLGVNLSMKDIHDLKINLNIYDLLNYNKIQKLTRDARVVASLNDYFLGFLSIDNAYLNMRRLVPSGKLHPSVDKRYINYSLFDNVSDSKKFYTIPTCFDYSKRVQIHIAEGPFDILSIYLNLRRDPNQIYTSIGGSNYQEVISFFLVQYGLFNIELHLYPDNDKFGTDEVMNDVLRFTNYLYPTYVHRNIMPKQKDFGVSLDKIQETIQKIN